MVYMTVLSRNWHRETEVTDVKLSLLLSTTSRRRVGEWRYSSTHS
jgi:hypothetical protein